MSKIGYAYYEATGAEIRKAFAKTVKERGQIYRAWEKIAKEIGADQKKFVVYESSDTCVLKGFKFEERPNIEVFRKSDVEGYDAWFPRGNTKKGKEILAKIKAVPKWTAVKDLEGICNYSMIFFGHHVYFFSWFHYKNGFCGIKVPVFQPEDYKKDKSLEYKAPKGLKEISWKTHNKKSTMTSKEYLATLPSEKKQKPSVKSSKASSQKEPKSATL